MHNVFVNKIFKCEILIYTESSQNIYVLQEKSSTVYTHFMKGPQVSIRCHRKKQEKFVCSLNLHQTHFGYPWLRLKYLTCISTQMNINTSFDVLSNWEHWIICNNNGLKYLYRFYLSWSVYKNSGDVSILKVSILGILLCWVSDDM